MAGLIPPSGRRSAVSLILTLSVSPSACWAVALDQSDELIERRETQIERALELGEAQLDDVALDSAAPLSRLNTASLIRLAQAGGGPSGDAAAAQPAAPPKQLTPEEIVAAIKLRAQREVAKRRTRRWSLSNYWSWTVANESNPALVKTRLSALYTEEYLSTTFSYKLTPKLTWQAAYNLDALNYNEYTDGSTLTNTLTTKLIWRLAKPWRAEAHYTFDDSDYPYDIGASTWDQKVHLRLRQSFWKHYHHYVGWTFLNKQYKDKTKRESTSTRVPGKYRKDKRHTMVYEIGGTFADANTLKVKQEFYFNDSNEGYLDYNDAQDYKVKLSFNRDWTDRWSSSSNFTYELKRYEGRTVSERGVAQQDYTKTYDVGFTYKLSKAVDLTYTWKYKQNDSNDTGQAYQDVTNSLALAASF